MENTVELKDFWTEEFAPKTLDDMVLSDELKAYFRNLISSKNRFNILLAGPPGIGKTTMAKIISNALGAATLFIPCGVEGTVATAQGKLKTFCDSLSMEGRPKLVILDELDSASGTQDNSFQKVLRNIVSESPDTMFIGTCNYDEKIIEPIKSRLKMVKLEFGAKDLVLRIKNLLDKKGVEYTRQSIMEFIEPILKRRCLDVRNIISTLQDCCSSGRLTVVKGASSNADENFVKEMVAKAMSSDNMLSLREYYLKNRMNIDDYRTFAGNVFNEAISSGAMKTPESILAMSDIIYQMNVVIDPEIQFFALLTLINKENRK